MIQLFTNEGKANFECGRKMPHQGAKELLANLRRNAVHDWTQYVFCPFAVGWATGSGHTN